MINEAVRALRMYDLCAYPLVRVCAYYKMYKAILTQIPDGFLFKNSACEISYGFEQITVRSCLLKSFQKGSLWNYSCEIWCIFWRRINYSSFYCRLTFLFSFSLSCNLWSHFSYVGYNLLDANCPLISTYFLKWELIDIYTSQTGFLHKSVK